MIDKTPGAHKYGCRVWENKLTGPGLAAAPLKLSITELTAARWKRRGRMGDAQTHTHSLGLHIGDDSGALQQVTCFIISRQSSCFVTCFKSFQLLSNVCRCANAKARLPGSFSVNTAHLKWLSWQFLGFCKGIFLQWRDTGQKKKKTLVLNSYIFFCRFF